MSHETEKIVVQSLEADPEPYSIHPAHAGALQRQYYENAPEVVYGTSPEALYNDTPKLLVENHPQSDEQLPEVPPKDDEYLPKKRFFQKKRWIILLSIVTLAAIIAIVLGGVLGARSRRRTNRPAAQGGNGRKQPAQPEEEKNRFFNGSGIVASVSRSTSTLFSQFHDGEIRRAQNLDGNWANTDEVVATGARNGSSIGFWSYRVDEQDRWNVFFIDTDDILRQRVRIPGAEWEDGPLSKQNIKASDSPNAGLAACGSTEWYGRPYDGSRGGLRIFFGNDQHVIQEMTWTDGDDGWEMGKTFDGSNGDGGVDCSVRVEAFSNVWFATKENKIQQWWFEFNETKEAPGHPAQEWVLGITAEDDVYNNTSVSVQSTDARRLVYVQQPDLSIRHIMVTNVGEKSTFGPSLVIGTGPCVPSTKLGNIFHPVTKAVYVFCQTDNSTLTQFSRSDVDTIWTAKALPTGPETE
ncbi:MAG: hypothetical protein M1833_007124 [Piccolia ochrophora]|nr:MAG: hypothetical protein M1833_007124 [Piccolia ochrophora]